MNLFKIILWNDLKGKNVKVKEGNVGIFRLLIILGLGKLYNFCYDLNVIYCEYIFIMFFDKIEFWVLFFDDFNDWKEISIYENGGIYDWMGIVLRRFVFWDVYLVNLFVVMEF